LRSSRIRLAVFAPIPGTEVRARTSSRATATANCSGVKLDNMASPVLGPSLGTEISTPKVSRSWAEEKPYRENASSRITGTTKRETGSPSPPTSCSSRSVANRSYPTPEAVRTRQDLSVLCSSVPVTYPVPADKAAGTSAG